MDIRTRDFGTITAEKNDIIYFTDSIYGFEEYKQYILLQDGPDGNIFYLQSIEDEHLAFILIDPYTIVSDYEPNLTDEDLRELKVNDEAELKFLVIAIVRESLKDSVVNLKSPISINPTLKIAKQVIVQNSEYPLRYPIFNNEGDEICL